MAEFMRHFVQFYNYFFAGYLAFYVIYLIISNVYGSIKMYHYRRLEQLHNELDHDYFFPISIIVPAYNEGETAVQTVKNLLKLDYSLFEIVIVDDGSTDNTKQLLVDTFSLVQEVNRPIRYSVPCHPIHEVYVGESNQVKLTLIVKENGGCKADASNAGINVSTYPYIVDMDADEILQKDALKYACRALLEDDNIIGIGGNLKISNDVQFSDAMPISTKLGKNLLVNMQVLEYSRGFIGAKIFQNEANANLIISGGYGIFKKSAVIEVGGYDTKSLGEDMELTLRLHHHYRKNKKKYSMKYVPDSVCWTQGPETMKDLRRQRERWHCGLTQTIAKYKGMILNPKYGFIGMLMLPYTILYELLNPIFMVLGLIIILWTLFDQSIVIPVAFYLYLIYIFFGIVLSMIAFLNKVYMKGDSFNLTDAFKCIFVGLAEAFFLKPYLSFINFLAFFKLKKIASKWESPSRIKVDSTDD